MCEVSLCFCHRHERAESHITPLLKPVSNLLAYWSAYLFCASRILCWMVGHSFCPTTTPRCRACHEVSCCVRSRISKHLRPLAKEAPRKLKHFALREDMHELSGFTVSNQTLACSANFGSCVVWHLHRTRVVLFRKVVSFANFPDRKSYVMLTF